MRKTVVTGHYALRVGAGLLIFASFSEAAFAIDLVPEVDPGYMTSALTLLTAGGMFVADRFLHRAKARAK